MPKTNSTLEYRLQNVETRLTKTNDKVDKLLVEYFPLMREDIIRINTRLNVSTAINVGAIIIGIIIMKMFGG